ncbi:MAG: HAD family hydrolase [Chloroflexales bacterium]|nr:HAD family hydrolase [Chloroflexales bacterium]
MQLKGIIFDLDGTITDTLPLCIHAFQHVFGNFLDRHYNEAEIVAMFGASEEGLIRRLMPEDWQRGIAAYLTEYERIHDQYARLFPGIETALQRLDQRGLRAAIVTGKGAQSTAITVQRFGLTPYFDMVETGSPDGPIKPQCIRKILAHWQISAYEAAYIGDTSYDIRAASEVGVVALGAAWDAKATVDPAGEPRPAAVFTSVLQFERWLDALIAPCTAEEV